METRALYQQTQTVESTVQVRLSRRWHKALLSLQKMEREGRELAIVEFGKEGPRCRKVGGLEGLG